MNLLKNDDNNLDDIDIDIDVVVVVVVVVVDNDNDDDDDELLADKRIQDYVLSNINLVK